MLNQIPYDTDKNKKLLPAAIEFVENPEPRCACVLLLDCSSSMGDNEIYSFGQSSISQLNEGIKELKKQLQEDDIASKRVEIAVVKFSTDVKVVSDFTTVDEFNPTELRADGATSMTEAIELAANMLEERKKDYKQNGIAYYRPWMFLITDGAPTDKNGHFLSKTDPRLLNAIKTLHNGVNSKQFTFFAVGVDGADMNILSKLSPQRPPVRLKDNKWSEMFEWLSTSLVSLSSSSMDQKQVNLPPAGWATVEV